MAFVVGALVIAGCSNSDEPLAPLQAPENSSQEISFAPIRMTRAAFDNESGSDWSTNNISVSCLAKTKQVSSTGAYDIDWTNRTESGRHTFVQMDNIDASVNKGQVSWVNHYYYPDVSFWYNYTFRGYYPRQLNSEVVWGEHSMKVNIPVDGTSDVLYGIADSKDDYAYSARYFHENADKAISELLPVLSFTHSLARLTFSMVAGSGATDHLKVKYIRAIHMYSKVQLTVADLVEPQNEGKVSVMGDNTYYYTLKDEQGDDVGEFVVPKTLTQIGESMLVYPTEAIPVTDEDKNGYRFEIGIEDPNDVSKVIASEPILLPKSGKAFEAGVSYNIEITVDGVEEISMRATLKPWQDNADGSITL